MTFILAIGVRFALRPPNMYIPSTYILIKDLHEIEFSLFSNQEQEPLGSQSCNRLFRRKS